MWAVFACILTHALRWAMRDSNPHGLRHQILSLACLPISAIARVLLMPAFGTSRPSYGRIGLFCVPWSLFFVPWSLSCRPLASTEHLCQRGIFYYAILP